MFFGGDIIAELAVVPTDIAFGIRDDGIVRRDFDRLLREIDRFGESLLMREKICERAESFRFDDTIFALACEMDCFARVALAFRSGQCRQKTCAGLYNVRETLRT